MDLLSLLDELEGVAAEAKPIPLTAQVRLDAGRLYDAIDRIRAAAPDAVAHTDDCLRDIADSLDELRQANDAATRPPPVTAAALDRVGGILQEAERAAAELRAEAEAEARGVREEAERFRAETHRRAADEAAAFLRDVEQTTRAILQRADSVDTEIDGLLENLRGTGGSVIGELEAIMANLSEVEVRRLESDEQAGRPAERDPGDAPLEGVDRRVDSAIAEAERAAYVSAGLTLDPADPPEYEPDTAAGEPPAGERPAGG